MASTKPKSSSGKRKRLDARRVAEDALAALSDSDDDDVLQMMGDRADDQGEGATAKVAPYLMAPTFSPPPPGRKKTPERSLCSAAVSSGNHSPGNSSIEHEVRKAYNMVRRKRDRERAKLVAKALKEDRDAVIDGTRGYGKCAVPQNCNEKAGGAPNGSNGRKRKQPHIDNDEGRHTTSPRRKKSPKKRKRSTVAYVAGERGDEDWCAKGDPFGSKKGGDRESAGKSESFPARSTPTLVFPRLPSNNSPAEIFVPPQLGMQSEGRIGTEAPPNLSHHSNGQPSYTLTITARNKHKSNATTTTTTHQPLLIEGCHLTRYKATSLIMLNSLLSVEDEPSLAHIPYFGDGNDEDIYSDLFDVEERKRLYELGPPYQQQETLETIDDVLHTMAKKKPKLLNDADLYEKATTGEPSPERTGRGAPSNVEKLEQIHTILAESTGVGIEVVRKRHLLRSERAKIDEQKPLHEDKDHRKKSASPSYKKNSDVKVGVPYDDLMDSYRDLLCRRCFTYDCNIHGNLPKANLDLLGELAVQKELDGHWKESDTVAIASSTESNGKKTVDSSNDAGELTPAQQSSCSRAYRIFQGDTGKIASAFGAAPSTVEAFVNAKKISSPPNKYVTAQQPSKKSGKKYTSMGNYNPQWLRHIESKTIHPSFLPCDHDEPCTDESCSCIQNGFFCTKHCGWGSKSPNFFRGCECKGQCQANSCSCYASKRECDPDLCKTCGACSDPPGAKAGEGQRCRNDNISMKRSAHLGLAESTVKEAGWGLFTKQALKKGDFVEEYVGEVISQEEAERRGVIYDKLNMSYLFNLSSDFVVDATRKGNLARYANHSSTPNIAPRMIRVNGDMRIGFFALKDIAAHDELFFDYRYDDKMDNELIYKPDHSVNFEWMK